ncbi:MAG: ferritin-like domain-containing protein [Planctomycetes bacterium]|nr:ferritin-like domain-containing protein [Planctomycetota bacterium]
MKVTTLAELYLDQLQDSRSSEQQIIKALPKMVKAAAHADLKKAFTEHLDITKQQLERLDLILADLEKSAGRKVCEATVGLIKEGSELIEHTEEGDVRDAGLICAAQKIEHYEIACYGCLRTFATLLGRTSDVKHLDKTLAEEKSADSSLTDLAMSVLNADAAAVG